MRLFQWTFLACFGGSLASAQAAPPPVVFAEVASISKPSSAVLKWLEHDGAQSIGYRVGLVTPAVDSSMPPYTVMIVHPTPPLGMNKAASDFTTPIAEHYELSHIHTFVGPIDPETSLELPIEPVDTSAKKPLAPYAFIDLFWSNTTHTVSYALSLGKGIRVVPKAHDFVSAHIPDQAAMILVLPDPEYPESRSVVAVVDPG